MLAAYIYAQNLLGELKEQLSAPRKGQGMVEYGLIIVLIAVVVIAALGPLGTAINAMFQAVTGNFGGE